uniref:ABC transporter domain-containing protein n=1 Tax=Paramoeba aestuarina TaxID=180227 RepID=A0A7S4KVM7_9EUKA|mmetsp:Transcript_2647/g.4083  ORF Transcript_2647/g.4083 Transcript_2647/m.4083 type:complete len:665 (+) Transcript_2647:96-2090(+)|eukprot:CAMPEP_0201520370 /NCGR_PEP_ID=MMETSP0161_2-20130828/10666_1 /ASSEMBLY_ACC=CAM_ASM_000251 /TAXON_ID=180227 /ORGANISM="Neoparamoeba aestuarina, Strain SoJaBio B1-5/56/2" /LENGTH=664 /DNA_ID=CAMNT_0047918695 /DNA_START=81 /DNA_END=2075 /DNA_ORIENTATION=-
MEPDEQIVEIADSTDLSDDSSGAPLKVSLTWDNINYQVQRQSSFVSCRAKKKPNKTLLNHVYGHVQVGECVAVMGPSGCGKSTLLDVLAGRVGYAGKNGPEEKIGGYTGEVRMGGMRMVGSDMKKHVAYVMQDDALYGVLTVRENLYYSAMLRLPESMSKKEKLERVEEVIEMLGLTKCADTKIGTPFIRGVSGGERRRCSIGMELITRPSILLLDEPTSGLDSKSSRLIVEILKDLAKSGRVVLFSIHQPSSEIYQLFDKIMLLSRGKQVFYGSPIEASTFFDSQGFHVPPMVNPADYFLEIINTDFKEEEIDENDETSHLNDVDSQEDQVEILSQGFSQSRFFQDLEKETKQGSESDNTLKDAKKYETRFVTQLFYLCSRRLWVNLIDLTLFWSRAILFGFMGVLIGSVYFQMGKNQDTINDRLGAFFYIVTFLSFMSVAAMPSLLIEREIFIRERRNGYYTVLPYSLSHSIMCIPFLLVMNLVFCVICYYMSGFEPGFDHFIYFFLVLFGACFIAEGIVMSIGAVAPSYIIGIVVAACVYGVFMLNGGFIITAKNIPDYYIWIHYIVFQKYAFEGLLKNEFSSISFPCDATTDPTTGEESCLCFFVDLNQDCVIQGDEVLEEFGYEDVPKWGWFGVLIGMAIFFHALFFVLLRFFNTGERK